MFQHTALHRTFEAALRDLDHRHAKVRASAARDLALHTDEHRAEVIERLVEALARDEDESVRAAAALGLADASALEAVPALLEAAEPAAPLAVRQMALTALGELGDPRAEPVARAALADPQAEVRFQAIMAFVRVCERYGDAVQAILTATEEDDPLLCHIALRMAEELGGKEEGVAAVAPAVVERARELLDHPADEVRVAAAIILGRSELDDGDDVLAAVAAGEVRTPQAEDEAAAIELCGRRSLPGAAVGLERRAFHGRLSLRRDPFQWHARVALAAMNHQKAIEWLVRELGSASRERRTLAAAAVGRAGVHAAREPLAALRKRTAGVDREVVDEALAALDSAPPTAREIE